jgi:hypothetical protein
MFLLLCLPQLRQWAKGTLADDHRTGQVRAFSLGQSFALWMNGSPNGHTTFMLVPQLANWLIFSDWRQYSSQFRDQRCLPRWHEATDHTLLEKFFADECAHLVEGLSMSDLSSIHHGGVLK